MAAFDPSVFWPEFKDAGMLSSARVFSAGSSFEIDVGFSQPDVDRFGGGAVSRDYEVEFQWSDAPDLAEGDRLVIDNIQYVVRQAPRITQPGNAADGFFRTVILTKVRARDLVLLSEDGDFLLTEDGSLILIDDASDRIMRNESGAPLMNEDGRPLLFEPAGS